MPPTSRRVMIGGAAATCAVAALAMPAIAQDASLRVGLMLPFSGMYAALGEAIAAGFDMHIRELDGKMGGRPVELLRVDDESDPTKAQSSVNRLLGREQVEVLVGSVQSDIAMTMARGARDQRIPLIIPHAGNNALTREQCGIAVFRSSFSNWQPAFGMGQALAAKGHKKVAWLAWDHVPGNEGGDGFADGLRTGGAALTQRLTLPFPETNFQPLLAQLSDLDVDAAGASFFGAGAIRFVKAYAAAGLRDKLPLCGPGFLTEGLLKQQGEAADGLLTALHYGDGIDNPKNLTFRKTYKSFARRDADVYAVQGYDAAQMLAIGLNGTDANASAIKDFAAAVMAAKIDSPRGAFTLSDSHNPIQTIWLRQVKNGENRVIGPAAEMLADPAGGCDMG
jgi:branched-chain amino acid transport system substrate-binding protein